MGASHRAGGKLKDGADFAKRAIEKCVAFVLGVPFCTSNPDTSRLYLPLSSLEQWASLRESLFGKSVLLVVVGLWFFLLQFGPGAQFVWTDNLWLELHSAGLSALLAFLGSFVFIEQAFGRA